MSDRPKGILAWFTTNHVAANLFMLLLIGGGLVSLSGLKVLVFPPIDPKTVTVTVPYPGATPAEIEESINRRVEEAIIGVEGIKRVRSVAREGLGTITAEVEDGADDREVLDDVKAAVDQIQDFPPEDAEEPKVVDTETQENIITLALHGEASERTLRELAYRVRDDLMARPQISQIAVTGVRDYEVGIEVSERSLRARGLTFAEVARAVAAFSVNLPGGSIRTADAEILLRTDGQAYRRLDFEGIVLRTNPDGTVTLLRDVAEIRDGFEDVDQRTLFNGAPAVLLDVKRVGDQRSLDIEEEVKAYLKDLSLPHGIDATIWNNRGDILRDRIGLLVRNGLMGLALVFGCLILFTDFKLAFWTTMGIPISFLGAMIVLPLFGASINMVSLFAFILVLGIVVDDAIVVGESIFHKRQQGVPPLRAAVEGLKEVIAPTSVAVLTTVVAFLPLYFTPGFFGKILWVVPVVVVSVLVISLFEAIFILPAHLSRGKPARKGLLPLIQRGFRAALDWLIVHTYAPVLKAAARYRYLTVALMLAVLMITGGALAGGLIKFVLFPGIDGDSISATVTMTNGTPAADTEAVVERMLTAAEETRREFDAKLPEGAPSVFRNISATIGSAQRGRGGPTGSVDLGSGGHLGGVRIELSASEDRPFRARNIESRWRERIGEIPGATSMAFASSLLTAGDDVSVEIGHADFQRLLLAVDKLKARLGDFPGVVEIEDSFQPGKRELRIALTDAGVAAGVTLGDLARQVRQAFYGAEAQRVQRGRDDIKVLVRYAESERRDLASIYEMRVRLPGGAEVPFRTVARVAEQRGYATIDRSDRRRVVTVKAKVDEATGDAAQVNADLKSTIMPQFARDVPGLTYSFEGAERERQESFQGMLKAFAVAVIAIVAILAIQLRSYSQPLIIMAVIPFGIVGAIIGHKILGFQLSFFSTFGVVALAGVVVNDSLILMDMINRLRREGHSAWDAVVMGGQRRFRPILFTTLTTCFGLLPMIAEKSLQAQFLIPVAISLASGVAFATVITLVIVPALYLIQVDVVTLVGRVGGWFNEDEPAPG